MKRLLILLTLLLMMALPALAEKSATLPVPAGCTLLGGWTGDTTAMHLMDRPDGATVLICYVRTEDGWVLTESTPLPEGTTLYTKYASEGCITLTLPGTATAEVSLTDGAWRVTGVICPMLAMDFRANGILGPECAWYGDVAFDGDITRIDWSSLPRDEEACLTLLDMSQWRYLAADTPALREGSKAADLYRQGTPVRLIGTEGATALVAVLGGDVRIRVPVEALMAAEGQIRIDEYVGYINPLVGGTPSIEVTPAPAIPLYDAPGGRSICTLAAGELHKLNILADCAEDGWFHIEAEWEDIDGFVRAEDLPADEGIAAAKQLLPSYIYEQGNADDEYCSFLMTNPAGERVFVGGVNTAQGWVFTESSPLPAGSVMDDYHSGSSSFIFSFPHPAGVESRWFEGETVWVTLVAYPQDDNRWLVETIMNENEEGFHIDQEGIPGYDVNMTGVVYGTVTLERDMRYIDWATFPLCLEDALPYLAEDMGVIGAEALLLYADAACTQVIAEYLLATPVTILWREGSLAQVRIADSDVTGWVAASALLTGADQLVPYDEEDPDDLVSAAYFAHHLDAPSGMALYDAPGGEIVRILEWPAWLTVMSARPDGWYHICFPESTESYWIQAE